MAYCKEPLSLYVRHFKRERGATTDCTYLPNPTALRMKPIICGDKLNLETENEKSVTGEGAASGSGAGALAQAHVSGPRGGLTVTPRSLHMTNTCCEKENTTLALKRHAFIRIFKYDVFPARQVNI